MAGIFQLWVLCGTLATAAMVMNVETQWLEELNHSRSLSLSSAMSRFRSRFGPDGSGQDPDTRWVIVA